MGGLSLIAGILTAVFFISISAPAVSAAGTGMNLPRGASEEISVSLDGRRMTDVSAYLIDSTT